MPVAPEVLAALEASLAADPAQDEVRQYLATLLLQAGRADDALEHAAQLLTRHPDSLEALRVAADAAAASAQPARAAGYRRLLEALGGAGEHGDSAGITVSAVPRDAAGPTTPRGGSDVAGGAALSDGSGAAGGSAVSRGSGATGGTAARGPDAVAWEQAPPTDGPASGSDHPDRSAEAGVPAGSAAREPEDASPDAWSDASAADLPADRSADKFAGESDQADETEESGRVVPLRAIEGGGEAEGEADLELPRVTLADVGGMEHVKRRLNTAFLGPMRNPELRSLFGKSLRGGLLLYGPPGCGKTFVARATAGEMGAKFLAVALSDVLDLWLGNSEKNLHELFQTARRNAPCVIFFDEVDALGRKRSHMRHSGGRNVAVQLLHEMDNATTSNEGVFVLAATNHPWDVDTALRRPGRLDRTLLVLPPDRPAREAILQLHLRDRPLDRVDVAKVAAQTDGYSGADLAHLCESAAEIALEDSLAAGKARPITMGDVNRARRDVRPSTEAWFETARNYANFANDGGVYDDLLEFLRSRK